MLKAISLVLPFSRSKELKVWFQIRESKDELNGLLELPGGKIEPFENPEQAARREFAEEVGLDISNGELCLLKIHEHSSISNMIFYIYGLDVEYDKLPNNGWHRISLDRLEEFKEKIPNENIIFLRDILKTL